MVRGYDAAGLVLIYYDLMIAQKSATFVTSLNANGLVGNV